MNKRGQFYIIVAIIISLALITVTTKINKVKEPTLFEDFDKLSNNYMEESRHVINHALYTKEAGPEIRTQVDNFTLEFLNLARENINPSTQIVYIYSNGSNITVGNHFNTSVQITNSTLLGSQEELAEEIILNVGGIDFVNKVPIKAENFGTEWYTSGTGNKIELSIGGVVHNFKATTTTPFLKAIVRLTSQDPIVLNIGGNESVDTDIRFSPEEQTKAVQQNVYE